MWRRPQAHIQSPLSPPMEVSLPGPLGSVAASAATCAGWIIATGVRLVILIILAFSAVALFGVDAAGAQGE